MLDFLSHAAPEDIPRFDYTRLVTPGKPPDPGAAHRRSRADYVDEARRVYNFLRPSGPIPLDDDQRHVPEFRSTPVPEHPPQLQHAAWTEAVSRCAEFFGVPEHRLPALLVLCLREENDVLIQLRADTSVYDLCKRIASHPGYLREDAGLPEARDQLRSDVSELEREWGSESRTGRCMQALATRSAVQKQIDGLHQHLGMIAHVDPDLGSAVADGLGTHVDSDTPVDEVRAWLSAMAERILAHPRRTELLHLDRKLLKVARSLEEAAYPGSRWRNVEKGQRDLAQARARLAELEQRLAARPGLATACEDAAAAALGECETGALNLEEYISLHRGHDARRIRTVQPVGNSPRPSEDDGGGTSNTLSETTVHGSAVQARDIDALHLHIHSDNATASPRSGRGIFKWLRGARGRESGNKTSE
ncbi:hypothetical protein GCM10010252_20890 [Streptomyces aureoverticillatus]|nr:hypothetical protein GCM10010252_20890 [Streptomyces aureoverticillatus]